MLSVILLTLGVITILVVHIIDYRQSQTLVNSFYSVEKSQQTRINLHRLNAALNDIQCSHRSYLNTHTQEFLVKYKNAKDVFPDLLNSIRTNLGADNVQQRLLDSLEKKINQELNYIEDAVVQINADRSEEPIPNIQPGRMLSDSIITLVARIDANERLKTEALPQRVRDEASSNVRTIIFGLVSGSLLVVSALLVMIRSHVKIEKLEKSFAEKNLSLSEYNEKAHDKLEKANAILQKANEELNSFSYSISHDLKAPLRAINGFTGILMEEYSDKLDPTARRALIIIQQSATRMDQLINDLVELSRVGNLSLEKQRINMQQLVATVLSAHSLKPEVTVKVHVLPDAYADVSSIRQVWENLISNALKFSSKGAHPVIEIGFSNSNNNEGYYWIKDNGVGFDPLFREKLFKLFSRLHSKKEFEGTGAGLAIARKIIELHGGKIWADAALNEGATFYFFLPQH